MEASPPAYLPLVAIAALSDCANDMHATCNVQRATCCTHTRRQRKTKWSTGNGKWQMAKRQKCQQAVGASYSPGYRPPPCLNCQLPPLCLPPPSPPPLLATLPHLAEVAYGMQATPARCSPRAASSPLAATAYLPAPPLLRLWHRAAAAPPVDAYMSEMLACPCCISALISFIAKVLDVN